MKTAIAATAILLTSTFSAFADDVEINGEYTLYRGYSGTEKIKVITLPGQNTDGTDLTCAIYDKHSRGGAGMGGISCDWAPAPTPSQ